MHKQTLGQGAEPGGGITSDPLNLFVLSLLTVSVLLSLVLFLQLLGLQGTLCAEAKDGLSTTAAKQKIWDQESVLMG